MTMRNVKVMGGILNVSNCLHTTSIGYVKDTELIEYVAKRIEPFVESVRNKIKSDITKYKEKNFGGVSVRNTYTANEYKAKCVHIARLNRHKFEHIEFTKYIAELQKNTTSHEELLYTAAMCVFENMPLPAFTPTILVERTDLAINSVILDLSIIECFRVGMTQKDVANELKVPISRANSVATKIAPLFGVTVVRGYENRFKISKYFSNERAMAIDELLRTGMHYKEVAYRLGITPLQKTSLRLKELVMSGEEMPSMLPVSKEIEKLIEEERRKREGDKVAHDKKNVRVEKFNERMREKYGEDYDEDLHSFQAQEELTEMEINVYMNTTTLSDKEIISRVLSLNEYSQDYCTLNLLNTIRYGTENGANPTEYSLDEYGNIVYVYDCCEQRRVFRHPVDKFMADIILNEKNEPKKYLPEGLLCVLNAHIVHDECNKPSKNLIRRYIKITKSLRAALIKARA